MAALLRRRQRLTGSVLIDAVEQQAQGDCDQQRGGGGGRIAGYLDARRTKPMAKAERMLTARQRTHLSLPDLLPAGGRARNAVSARTWADTNSHLVHPGIHAGHQDR